MLPNEPVWLVSCYFPGTGRVTLGCVVGEEPEDAAEYAARGNALMPSAYGSSTLTWVNKGSTIVGTVFHPLAHERRDSAVILCERLRRL